MLSAILLAVSATSCAAHDDTLPAAIKPAPSRSLVALALTQPRLAALLARGADVVPEQTAAGWSVTWQPPGHPAESTAREGSPPSRWRSSGDALRVDIDPAHADEYSLRVGTHGPALAVRRTFGAWATEMVAVVKLAVPVAPSPTASVAVPWSPVLEPGPTTRRSLGRTTNSAIHLQDASGAAESFVFASGLGVEELVLVRSPELPLGYELDEGGALRLQLAPGGRPVVEIRLPSGRPYARMVVERAWDASGRELRPELRLEGTRVHVALPEVAAWPVVLDPEWQPAGVLSQYRSYATATLLPSGKVLIAGGLSEVVVQEALGTAELYDPVTATFEPTGSMSDARAYHSATMLPSGNVLIAGGLGPATSQGRPEVALATAELYDPARGEFLPLPTMTEARAWHTATALAGGEVLIAGGARIDDSDGYTRIAQDTAELFDPTTSSFVSTGALQIARSAHSATRLPNGRVVLVGGYSSLSHFEAVTPAASELFVPEDGAFALAGELGEPRWSHAAILLPQAAEVLVAGGLALQAGQYAAPINAELLGVEAGVVVGSVPMNAPHADGAAALLPDGRALIVGGTDGLQPGGVTEIYACGEAACGPVAGQFATADATGAPIQGAAPLLLPDGSLLLVGSALAQRYDPSRPAFGTEGTDSTPQPLEAHTATLLPTGAVLVVGDMAQASQFVMSDLSPESGSFVQLEGGPGRRHSHSATVLPDGRVLLVGGRAGEGEALADAWLFDPWTRQFDTAGELAEARARHTATLLGDGRVLVAGGMTDPIGPTLASAELFDPAVRSWTTVGSLTTGRRGAAALRLEDGRVLVVGGSHASTDPTPDQVELRSGELYDPHTGAFSALGPEMALTRGTPNAAMLDDGRVLVAGGAVFPPWSAELLDLDAQRFELVAGIDSARFGATSTRLASGRILVAGGVDATGTTLSGTELFDHRLDAMEVGPPMDPAFDGGRAYHAATMLPDGSVLFTGGYSSAQQIDPATTEHFDAWPAVPDSWRPRIHSIAGASLPGTTVPVLSPGTLVTLTGEGFTGVGEASGSTNPSPTNYPVVLWRPLEGRAVYGELTSWSDREAEWRVPSTSHPGPGLVFVAVNGILGPGAWVTIAATPDGLGCGADGACASGYCTDGVCCETRCDEGCEACSAARKGFGLDGVCEPHRPHSDPEGDCADAPAADCGLTGSCDGTGQCARFPDGTQCQGPGTACHGGACLRERCYATTDCPAESWCDERGVCVPMPAADALACSPACAIGVRATAGRPRPLSLLAVALVAAWRRARRARRRRSAPAGRSAGATPCQSTPGTTRPRWPATAGESRACSSLLVVSQPPPELRASGTSCIRLVAA